MDENQEMQEEKNQDLAEKASTAVGNVGTPKIKKGLEEPSQQEDMEIPRAKLMQSNSPEVLDSQKSGGKLIPGVVINSLTKEVLPEEFVPVFKFTNWVRFNPKNKDDPNFDPAFDPKAIIWRSKDPNDPKVQEESKWGVNGEPPAATKFLNFFAYFPGVDMPIVISFCNTSFKAGKKLNSLCQFSKGDAIYERKYKLKTKEMSNDKGTFSVFEVKLGGESSPEDYAIADGFYNSFGHKVDSLKIDEESQEGEFEKKEEWKE